MNADKPLLRKQLKWKALFTDWVKVIIFYHLRSSAFICGLTAEGWVAPLSFSVVPVATAVRRKLFVHFIVRLVKIAA